MSTRIYKKGIYVVHFDSIRKYEYGRQLQRLITVIFRDLRMYSCRYNALLNYHE